MSIKRVKQFVNECICEVCTWPWKSFGIPTHCPHCGTRKWNGGKPRGRRKKIVAGINSIDCN